jgi:NADPH-dependent curcumin reductase CurA
MVDYLQLIMMRLSIRGFLVTDYLSHFGEVIQIFIKALQEGKLKISSENEQIVDTNFDDVPKTWLKLFEGGNTGKLITKLV